VKLRRALPEGNPPRDNMARFIELKMGRRTVAAKKNVAVFGFKSYIPHFAKRILWNY
jgi:hypothetical protein